MENSDLRQKFNPRHPLATPIMPERKKFKHKNIEYQRTNFALSLAYALTAHKCQGDTLEEVIIDFGPDKERGIKNFILPGSFYVALTRVWEGSHVFLKSFDNSYIVVNEAIEEKISTMRKFDPYRFKKIYIDERIFEDTTSEIKVGYLNINRLLSEGHAEYLNQDKNLVHLDLLAISETKLDANSANLEISRKLDNWQLICRHDANDGSAHMGLILLSPKLSEMPSKIESFRLYTEKRSGQLQVQVLTIRILKRMNIGFIYCRSSPNDKETKKIRKILESEECDILMGDLNLSSKSPKDKKKLDLLCENKMTILLTEITRRISNNQLDHVLVRKESESFCYATSYFNFVSDHNSIVIRISDEHNQLTQEAMERIHFSQDLHLRSINARKECFETSNFESIQAESTSKIKHNKENRIHKDDENSEQFGRRIMNPDASSCWLNSCLQLLLTALDHSRHKPELHSELGTELLKIQNLKKQSYDPTPVKNILVSAEDTRIAVRESEIMHIGLEKHEVERQIRNLHELYLNLKNGQQCVRDFFVCLRENLETWYDVYDFFSMNMINSTTCIKCGKASELETNHLYIEIDVPPIDMTLNQYVEEIMNGFIKVDYNCKDGCKMAEGAENRMVMKSCQETELFIVILRRVIQDIEGVKIVNRSTETTHRINIRYQFLFG